jgi:hypothetical protein
MVFENYIHSRERTRNTKRYIAFHESGHAVAALVFGIHFRDVTIRYNNVSCGSVNGLGESYYTISAIISLCGPISQSKFENKNELEYNSSYMDIDDAEHAINGLITTLKSIKYKNGYRPCEKKLYNDMFTSALILVNSNWDQIKCISENLLKLESDLSYYDCVTLLLENGLYDSMIRPELPKLEGHFDQYLL